MNDDYKGGFFGGIPTDELTTILTHWGTTARPGAFSDAQWIAALEEKVRVLEALVKEENAAANAGNFDTVSVVMKAMDVRQTHRDALNSGSSAQLLGAIAVLQGAWKA